MPRWPWSDVPIIDAKAGDILVHLCGILAFCVAGFDNPVRLPRIILLAACAAVIGSYERAGLVALGGCFLICLFLKPTHPLLHRLLAVGVAGLLFLAVSGINFEVPSPDTGKARVVSFDDMLANFVSIVSDTDVSDLDETKQWRLEWWSIIFDYTFKGPYVWTGKGFGVNLADDDGFQVWADHSLRSPHNGHLTMLARAGVPGLALWILVQLSFACSLIRAYRRSCHAADSRWSALFLFLLVYWFAFMTNAAFDVFIEGPMGGIWFWTIYGIGLASVWLYKHSPEVLRDAPSLHHY